MPDDRIVRIASGNGDAVNGEVLQPQSQSSDGQKLSQARFAQVHTGGSGEAADVQQKSLKTVPLSGTPMHINQNVQAVHAQGICDALATVQGNPLNPTSSKATYGVLSDARVTDRDVHTGTESKTLKYPQRQQTSILAGRVRQGSIPHVASLTAEFKKELQDLSSFQCSLKYIKTESNAGKDVWRGKCCAVPSCPVTYAVYFYLRETDAMQAHSVKFVQHFEHDHGDDAVQSFKKAFTPAARKIAESYVREHRQTGVSAKALRRHLEFKKIDVGKLNNKSLSNWIARDSSRLSKDRPVAGPSTQSLVCSTQEWNVFGKHQSSTELVLLNGATLDGKTGFIPFSCQLFLDTARRWCDEALCLGTDVKMKVIREGWGVASVGVLFKDTLRNTTVGRLADRTKVQMKARTTRYLPYLFALINEDGCW